MMIGIEGRKAELVSEFMISKVRPCSIAKYYVVAQFLACVSQNIDFC